MLLTSVKESANSNVKSVIGVRETIELSVSIVFNGSFMHGCREYRGPVTNVSSLEGYLILTIGNKLEVHQWTGSSLLRTAFFDAPMLISSLNVVKTFILFGDVHKSIYFVQYRDQVWLCFLQKLPGDLRQAIDSMLLFGARKL